MLPRASRAPGHWQGTSGPGAVLCSADSPSVSAGAAAAGSALIDCQAISLSARSSSWKQGSSSAHWPRQSWARALCQLLREHPAPLHPPGITTGRANPRRDVVRVVSVCRVSPVQTQAQGASTALRRLPGPRSDAWDISTQQHPTRSCLTCSRGRSAAQQPCPAAPAALQGPQEAHLGHRKHQPPRCLLLAPPTQRAPILIISLESDNGFQEHCSLSAR